MMRINEHVSSMSPPRYTRSQAARLIGRKADTLKRWQQEGIYFPSEQRVFGKIKVNLYDDRDIENMKVLAESVKPGQMLKRLEATG